MSNRKEGERNEKIIRGLQKLPANRNCINCNSPGPQYVCTNFWTFVCTTCSGIHREFAHRVKSISMSNFTKQEVEALQRGGNQCAKEAFLKDWDMQQMKLPDISNPDKIRAFIRDVYLKKKYAGRRVSDMPPRDMQNLKKHDEERRRASAYYSSLQSPPYENRYDGMCYEKQMCSRLGSDLKGKTSSFVHSSGRLREQLYEDRSANGSLGSRTSDYSISSSESSFRYDGHSTNSTIPRLNQETASSSSFGSPDCSSVDVALESELSSGNKQAIKCINLPLSLSPASVQARNDDLFHLPFVYPPMNSPALPLDLFASWEISPKRKPSLVPISENDGWITFDITCPLRSVSTKSNRAAAVARPVDEVPKRAEDAIPSVDNNSKGFSVQYSIPEVSRLTLTGKGYAGLRGERSPAVLESFQSWTAFDDIDAKTPHTSSGGLSHDIEPPIFIKDSQMAVDPYAELEVPESWTVFDDIDAKTPHTSFGGLSHDIEPPILIKDSQMAVDPHTSFGGLSHDIEPPILIKGSQMVVDPYAELKVPEASYMEGHHMVPVGGLDLITGSLFSPFVPSLLGRATQVRKLTNPFDLPFDPDSGVKFVDGAAQLRKSRNPFDLPDDSDSEVNNVFCPSVDMSSSAVPSAMCLTAQLGGANPPWPL